MPVRLGVHSGNTVAEGGREEGRATHTDLSVPSFGARVVVGFGLFESKRARLQQIVNIDGALLSSSEDLRR